MDQSRYQTPPPVPSQPSPGPPQLRAHKFFKSKDLTRSQRIRCRTLHFNSSMSYEDITKQLHFTQRQIQTACTQRNTPTKRSGRPLTLSSLQIDQLIDFIRLSRHNRRMTYLELAINSITSPFACWNVSERIIGHALATRGYNRHIALGKPGLSEKTQRLRREWAEEHKNWTIEQWSQILWSDETWVNGFHRKIWITRMSGEEFDDTCLFTKQQRRRGWMFWGCFSGHKKGPCLFWEKGWKTINSERYCEHTLPLVERYITLHPYLKFMQDNAPAHGSKYTKIWLQNHQLIVIKWPPNSPDLNPIEIIWNRMKQWIQETYGIEIDEVERQGHRMNYDRLKQIVQEAWDQITEDDLNTLLHSMKDRCQAVINAHGLHTRY